MLMFAIVQNSLRLKLFRVSVNLRLKIKLKFGK